MRDDRIETWGDLIDAFYEIPHTRFGRYRSDFVYRGLADQSWDLKTSLIRLGGSYQQVERPLLRSFRKYAQPGWLPTGNREGHSFPQRARPTTTQQAGSGRRLTPSVSRTRIDNLSERAPTSPMIAHPAADNLKPLQ